jgi:hypothetical protein
LQNIKFQLPAFSKVWVTTIPTCDTTQFTYYVRAQQLQNPVWVCAHRDGSHEENVHVTSVCGVAVTASDIHLKLYSVKERVEGRQKATVLGREMCMGGTIEGARRGNGTDTWENEVKDKERKKSGRFNPHMG